jgi:hypothetical protein
VKLELTEGILQETPSKSFIWFHIFPHIVCYKKNISRNAAQKCVETSSVDYTSNYIMDSP